MNRSILVTEIYIQATKARIALGDDSAALTLMSTDIERIRVGFRNLHEPWAASTQAALALWMLYNRLGVVFVAPFGIVILCFIFLSILMNWTGDSQRSWMSAVQKRVGLTSTVVGSMKNVRISGLTVPVGEFVQKLRVDELAKGVRWRKIFITAAMLGFFPHVIAPPITFAAAQTRLDVSTTFTSLAFITLLTYPLLQVFEGIPQILSAVACVGRIQAFLECETREDFRKVLEGQLSEKTLANPPRLDDTALIISNGAFGWEPNKFVLRNVNAEIRRASLTLVVGPVGSGKSTLCKALLGEIPFSSGNTVIADTCRLNHVGFCEQVVFLSNGTIRDNILGFTQMDQQRYLDVIHATTLHLDFVTLPQGDRTNIGSDGVMLSGGQKQRVALARALYLQSEFLILDDIFSGLDADTEETVFQNVFGPDGLVRRRQSTVILCTHSIRHLPAADHILVLNDGALAEQGTFQELNSVPGYVRGLALRAPPPASENLSDSNSTGKAIPIEQKEVSLATETLGAVFPAKNVDPARAEGDKTVYKHYAHALGWFLSTLSLFFGICWGFFTNFPTICKYSYLPSQQRSDLVTRRFPRTIFLVGKSR